MKIFATTQFCFKGEKMYIPADFLTGIVKIDIQCDSSFTILKLKRI